MDGAKILEPGAGGKGIGGYVARCDAP